MNRRPVLSLVIFLAAWSGATGDPAVAAKTVASDAEARRLFERAEKHFAADRYREALQLYQRAFELRPLPGFLFNVAQCHRLLGETDQAVVFFREYLRRYPDSPHREQVGRLIAQLQDSPTDDGNPPTAQSGAASGAVLAPPTEVPPAPLPAVSDLDNTEATARGASSTLRKTLLWSGVGLSAALLTTGLITGQLASAKADEYAEPGPPEDREDLKREGQALRTASIATLISGGVVAVATALYFWLGD